jgi:DNA-binding transcriptional MerR regulator
MAKSLPSIPAKRYFTIGEVSELCQVKPYVLRYWEQEFTQLKPMKRRGNRRYYQHHEVLLIRRIRELLYDQGFTISGARNRLAGDVPPPGAALDTAFPSDPTDPDGTLDAATDLPGEMEDVAIGAGSADSAPVAVLARSAAGRFGTPAAGGPAVALQATAPATLSIPVEPMGPDALRHELLQIRELLTV